VRVALAGCRDIHDPDEPALIQALARIGVTAEGHPWDAPVDWPAYDLVVVRSTWDYVDRRAAFLAWADAVPRLANPASVLRWNTDKRYLARLAAAGVPVVPTTYVTDAFTPPPGQYVVKPTVSAAAMNTAKYGPGEDAAAHAHVERVLSDEREVMVQPYVASVETQQETSLLYLGGEFSHGAHKGRVLTGVGALSPTEWDLGPREPSAAERAVAEQVLAEVEEPLLYARVDLVRGLDGAPRLIELELIEPDLYLGFAEDAGAAFAAAVKERLGR
jgi:glutathione synthase/RimK-type ligase-like ATP-grasp enzyme